MLLKIIGIGVVCVFLSLILKQYKPEFALLVSVCGGLVIFFMTLSSLSEVVNELFKLTTLTNIGSEFLTPIVKVIGVGYITEFVSDIAEDSGNRLVANKVIMGGKIAICLISLPIIKNLINTIISVIL